MSLWYVTRLFSPGTYPRNFSGDGHLDRRQRHVIDELGQDAPIRRIARMRFP